MRDTDIYGGDNKTNTYSLIVCPYGENLHTGRGTQRKWKTAFVEL